MVQKKGDQHQNSQPYCNELSVLAAILIMPAPKGLTRWTNKIKAKSRKTNEMESKTNAASA